MFLIGEKMSKELNVEIRELMFKKFKVSLKLKAILEDKDTLSEEFIVLKEFMALEETLSDLISSITPEEFKEFVDDALEPEQSAEEYLKLADTAP